ncbi:MAG: type II toxin-antitoxin system VapC family toxin [Thermoplasmata archaeon]
MTGIQVIDSSILVKYVSHESGWEKAGDFVTSGTTLGFALLETGNALWKKAMRHEIALEDLKDIVESLRSMVLVADDAPFLYKAIILAVKLKITVYDAMFIQFALENEGELVTSDRKQAEAAELLGVEVARME